MGMIFLGAGTSIPEVVSSVTATMQGNVDIGISNAISSNIFDILLCLGIPWATRTLLVPLISGKPCVRNSLHYVSHSTNNKFFSLHFLSFRSRSMQLVSRIQQFHCLQRF